MTDNTRKGKAPYRNRSRKATEDEKRLWRDVMRDVKPIQRDTGTVDAGSTEKIDTPDTPHTAKQQPGSDRKIISQRSRRPQSSSLTAQTTPTPPPKPRKHPESGIDSKTLNRLRRGKMAIEAVLDLHGMRQSEAHQRLITFIQSCWSNDRRSLLVITGKGTRSQTPGGVLRQKVPQWLHLAPVAEKVLTIQPAQPKDGGSGAYYVLLRRRRHQQT